MSRFTPLFSAKVDHIVEKHSDVSGGHGGGASGHIFCFRGGHGNRGWHCRVGFNESTIVKNHVSNGGGASIGAVLPAGIGEYREIGVWDAIVKADFIDGIGSAVGVEFEGIGGSAAKVTDEPGEGSKVDSTRRDACFSKFADCKGCRLVCCMQGRGECRQQSGREGVVAFV